MYTAVRRTNKHAPTIKHKFKTVIFALSLAAFTVVFLSNAEKYSAVCFEGIRLWAQSVLPTLFPFMIICALAVNGGLAALSPPIFIKASRALKLPDCAATCLILGAASGYPAGSRTVASYFEHGYADAAGAAKLAVLCTACGPVFTIATLGTMFKDSGVGLSIYAAHIAAVIILAIIFSLATKGSRGRLPHAEKSRNVLEDSFYGSVKSALTAGAFIAFFYTAAAMAEDLGLLYPVKLLLTPLTGEEAAGAFARGLAEMTGGIAKLAGSDSSLKIPLTGFLVTFGGACVLFQQLACLKTAHIKPVFFILFKLIQAALCFVILLIAT